MAGSPNDLESDFMQQLDVKYAYETTKKLCEMSLHKIAGTPREHETASAIWRQMDKIGLDDVRMDPFPIYTSDLTKGASLRVLQPEEKDLYAFPMVSTFPTKDDGVTAELVYVGLGKAEDFDKVNVDARIVLVRRDWPDMAGEDSYHRIRSAIEAWVRNALGIIVFDELAPDDIVRTQLYNMYPVELPVVCVPRNIAKYMISLCERGAVRVNLKSNIQIPTPGRSQNVLGFLRGTKYPDQYVLVASHYDTWWHGAVDSLSGIGSVLAVAKAMKETGFQPLRSVVFMAHGSEESGWPCFYDWLWGSYSHIFVNHPDWVGRTAAVLNADCVGYGESDCFVETTPELYPGVREVVQDIGMKPRLVSHCVPTARMLTHVDSASYIFAGVPSANIMFWPDEYWQYYHTYDDKMNLVTEESLLWTSRLWGVTAMRMSRRPLPMFSFSKLGKAISAALAAAKKDLRSAAETRIKFSPAIEAARKLADAGKKLDKVHDHPLDEAALKLMKAASILNREIYTMGGGHGFNMFLLPTPYVLDAVAVRSAQNNLKEGKISIAIENLERTHYLRGGRHNSRAVNETVVSLLRPSGWATRVHRYVNCYSEWQSLRCKLNDGDKDSRSELRGLEKKYSLVKLDLESSMVQLISTMSNATGLLEDVISQATRQN